MFLKKKVVSLKNYGLGFVRYAFVRGIFYNIEYIIIQIYFYFQLLLFHRTNRYRLYLVQSMLEIFIY